ncbi:hypothetical protein [Devosia sp. 63-57]|uniref:hypothetical protein n=1 Tax=Devosia sp. 63-57 TaxID=1895751 RepID=UPI00086953F4|nr:hypothetical protein [Devosia sp. 63-57]ODT50288.1 MAG: hypothetical protein ABS74_05055 [Pelagibacterium sp. SCN 63-126]ODU82752.1 MAG: hypothetical protein ABT14_16545 [Pelagibacterium sp. SCN 63-17]OJX45032.1 MAG: hypothetical protein BGO80_04055 [Devosia sp. 63-57]
MSTGGNIALSIAIDAVAREIWGAGKSLNFTAVLEGLVLRGFGHLPMGELKTALREKIAALQSGDAQ